MKLINLIILVLISSTLEIKLDKKMQKTFLQMFQNAEEDKKEEAKPEEGQDKKEEPKENVKEELEGWFSIKSLSLKAISNFPVLTMPGGRKVSFKFEKKTDFLQNQLFNRLKKSNPDLPQDDNLFYFHTNKNLIYFTPTKAEKTVLAAFKIKSAKDISIERKGYCIDTQPEEYDEKLTLCSRNNTEVQTLMCSLKKFCNQPLPFSCREGGLGQAALPPLPIQVTEVVKEPVFVIPQAARHCNEGWNYDKQGTNWECICSEGFEQSPIELPTRKEAIESDIAPVFYFSPLPERKSISYQDNLLRMDATNLGTITTLNGEKYASYEIKFHTPAEHIIKDEEPADMEMEIIYKGITEGDTHKQAVLSFLFRAEAGKNSKFFDAFDLMNLPDPLNDESVLLRQGVTIPFIQYPSDEENSSGDYSLKAFSFYTYQGSLSAPPCTERTIRYVAADKIPLSTTVIEFFKDALNLPNSGGMTQTFNLQGTTSFTGGATPKIEDASGEEVQFSGVGVETKKTSNRAVQNINQRQVFYWDMIEHCGLPTPKEKPIEGHYESILRPYTHYYKMESNEPSGLPGSFVIDKSEAEGVTAV